MPSSDERDTLERTRPRLVGSTVKTLLESGPKSVDGDGDGQHLANVGEGPHVDPFACFGSDSSSGSDGGSDSGNDGRTPHSAAAANLMKGQRLKSRNNDAVKMARVGITPITSTRFEVFDAGPHSGKGLRANVPYKRGDEIIREVAAMRIRNTQPASNSDAAEDMHRQAVQNAYDSMHRMTQRAFMDLSSCREAVKTPRGVYDTNSYRLGDDDRGGLFLTISRINHSCRPNVSHYWREGLQQTLVFAARDIEAGEELFTTYGPSSCMDTKSRREYLKNRFQFHCNCQMCAEGNTNGGDERMAEIQSLQEDIAMSSSIAAGDPTAALESVTKCLALMHEQGICSPAYTKSIYHYGYDICTAAGEDEQARSYLSRELKAVQESEGVGSVNAIQIEQVLSSGCCR